MDDVVVDVPVAGVVVLESDAVFVVVVVVAVIVLPVVVALLLVEAVAAVPDTYAFVVEVFVSALEIALFLASLTSDVTRCSAAARVASMVEPVAGVTQSAEAAFFSWEPVGPTRSLFLLTTPEFSWLPPPPPPLPLTPSPPPPFPPPPLPTSPPPVSLTPPCSFFV